MPSPQRRRPPRALVAAVALALVGGAACGEPDEAGGGPSRRAEAGAAVDRSGRLGDGTEWRLRAPEAWNGTLLLYNRGAVVPGTEIVVLDAPDEVTANALLEQGYALIGSGYEAPGWVLESAVQDQHELLSVAEEELGEPRRRLTWGSSMGALVTVGLLEEHPDDLDGGVAMCGVVGGVDLTFDPLLDVAFVLRTLLLPGEDLPLADFRSAEEAAAADQALRAAITHASSTPRGRAQLALAAAVADVPAWVPGPAARPAVDDLQGQLAGQVANLSVIVPFTTLVRADVEERVGGNPSSNVGVDYGRLLAASQSAPLVRAAYGAAGLEVAADLAALAAAPRIRADEGARAELREPVAATGELEDPLVTLHGTGDGLALPFHVREYADRVAAAGRSHLVRELEVERSGHCTFTVAEQLAALGVLIGRVATGAWPATTPTALGTAAAAFVDTTFPPSPRTATGQQVP